MSFHSCPICHMDCVNVDSVTLHIGERKGQCVGVLLCSEGKPHKIYAAPEEGPLPQPDPPAD